MCANNTNNLHLCRRCPISNAFVVLRRRFTNPNDEEAITSSNMTYFTQNVVFLIIISIEFDLFLEMASFLMKPVFTLH